MALRDVETIDQTGLGAGSAADQEVALFYLNEIRSKLGDKTFDLMKNELRKKHAHTDGSDSTPDGTPAGMSSQQVSELCKPCVKFDKDFVQHYNTCLLWLGVDI